MRLLELRVYFLVKFSNGKYAVEVRYIRQGLAICTRVYFVPDSFIHTRAGDTVLLWRARVLHRWFPDVTPAYSIICKSHARYRATPPRYKYEPEDIVTERHDPRVCTMDKSYKNV